MIQPLHYTVAGEGSALVLIHGGLSNGTLAFARTAASLAHHHRVITVDRRGHGNSPRDPKPYTIQGDAQDVMAVADAEDVTTMHVVGHSYGGLVALDMLGLAPERIASLHLIEPPILGLLPNDPMVQGLRKQGERLVEQATGMDGETLAGAFLTMVAGPAFVAMVRERPVWSQLVAEAERLKHEQFAGYYLLPEHVDASVPIRIYTGGRSHEALRQIAYGLVAVWPHARCIDIPDAYHDVQKVAQPFEQALLAVTLT